MTDNTAQVCPECKHAEFYVGLDGQCTAGVEGGFCGHRCVFSPVIRDPVRVGPPPYTFDLDKAMEEIVDAPAPQPSPKWNSLVLPHDFIGELLDSIEGLLITFVWPRPVLLPDDIAETTKQAHIAVAEMNLELGRELLADEVKDASAPAPQEAGKAPQRVKLIPLKSTWTCPACVYQNVYDPSLISDPQNECFACGTEVRLGAARTVTAPPAQDGKLMTGAEWESLSAESRFKINAYFSAPPAREVADAIAGERERIAMIIQKMYSEHRSSSALGQMQMIRAEECADVMAAIDADKEKDDA